MTYQAGNSSSWQTDRCQAEYEWGEAQMATTKSSYALRQTSAQPFLRVESQTAC